MSGETGTSFRVAPLGGGVYTVCACRRDTAEAVCLFPAYAGMDPVLSCAFPAYAGMDLRHFPRVRGVMNAPAPDILRGRGGFFSMGVRRG